MKVLAFIMGLAIVAVAILIGFGVMNSLEGK